MNINLSNLSSLPIVSQDDVIVIGRMPPAPPTPAASRRRSLSPSSPRNPPPDLRRDSSTVNQREEEIPIISTNTRKCGHCREVGHIVSHCPVIRNAAKAAMDYYLVWLSIIVVDCFIVKWNYTEDTMSRFNGLQKQYREYILCPRMKAILNQYKNEPTNVAITSVLNALPPYLEDISDENLVALTKAHRKNLSKLPSFSMRNIPQVKQRLHSSLLMQTDINLVTSRLSCYHSVVHEEHWPIERQLYVEKSLKIHNILRQAVGFEYNISPRDRVRALESMQKHVATVLGENEYRLRNKQTDLVNIEPRIRKITQRIQNLQQEIADLEITRTRVENSRPGIQNDIVRLRRTVEANSMEMTRFRNIPIIPKIAFADTDADAPVVLTDLCPICFEEKPVEEHCNTQCGHLFCNDCIIKHLILQYKRMPSYMKSNFSCCCPYCRADITTLSGDYKRLRGILRQACDEAQLPYNELLRAIGGRRFSAMLDTVDLSIVVPVCQPDTNEKNESSTNERPSAPIHFPVSYRDVVYVPH